MLRGLGVFVMGWVLALIVMFVISTLCDYIDKKAGFHTPLYPVFLGGAIALALTWMYL